MCTSKLSLAKISMNDIKPSPLHVMLSTEQKPSDHEFRFFLIAHVEIQI